MSACTLGRSCDVEKALVVEAALQDFFLYLLRVCWCCHCRNVPNTLWQGITLYVRYCLEE